MDSTALVIIFELVRIFIVFVLFGDGFSVRREHLEFCVLVRASVKAHYSLAWTFCMSARS